MPEPVILAKATLYELDSTFRNVINLGRKVELQFNPESLKVSFSNQTNQASAAGDPTGTASSQFVGAGTTKLTLQATFDLPTLAASAGVQDVRELTQKVAYFITPDKREGKVIPPGVRFLWGSFQFDGLMDSLEESLEFFSPEGRPLRAVLSLGFSRQEISIIINSANAGPPGGASSPGTRPTLQASVGASLQRMAGAQGLGGNWQAIAEANGIDNPRLLAPGQRIDLNLSVRANLTGP